MTETSNGETSNGDAIVSLRKTVRESIDNAGIVIEDSIPADVKAAFKKGPASMQYCSLAVGAAIAIINLFNLYDVLLLVVEPATFVLHIYQVCGGLLIVFLELDPDWNVFLASYRGIVNEQAHFLTHLPGRGVFYLFQGSISFVQNSMQEELVGLITMLLGLLYIAYYFYLPSGAKVEAETYLRTGKGSFEAQQPLLG